MTDKTAPRAPAAFDADDPSLRTSEAPDETTETAGTTKRRFDPAAAADRESATPDRDKTDPADTEPSEAGGSALSQGIRWGALLFTAMFGLLALATGVWFARFTSVALTREDWVGWLAQGLVAVLLVAAVALILKELFGFLRLSRLSRIRRDADQAVMLKDRKLEERSVRALKRLATGRSAAKWGLAEFREQERHMTAQGELLGLADTVLLREPDKHARRIVFESARRVGVVTAVVPVAFLVMLFVLAENVRMVRRLATAYGGRPGLLGGMRLLWRVVMHVAATGAVALTDDLFGQFLGQDVVRRVSRRLGEGAFVGALTARLGVAAIEVCRPLPYIAAAPLRSRHIVSELFPEIKPSEIVKSAFRSKDNKDRNTAEPS